MTPTKSLAIQTALAGDWKKAIEINKELLKENDEDLDTLNRLAHAYVATGHPKEAKNTYQKVLKLDPKNPIAIRCLKRLPGVLRRETSYSNHQSLTALFLEESGKTKVVELINVAEPKLILLLSPGETVHLRVKRMKVFVLDSKNTYIGMLPDNLGKRLLSFINGGNIYDAFVKSVQNHNVSIFIKETKRANKFKNQPTFTLLEKTKTKFDKSTPKEEKRKPTEEEDQEEVEDEEES